jgi:hypothetical protein
MLHRHARPCWPCGRASQTAIAPRTPPFSCDASPKRGPRHRTPSYAQLARSVLQSVAE